MGNRQASVQRKTKETEISATLRLDGAGISQCATGIGFFDHMLEAFARHGLFDLELRCRGDLHVDGHHTVEDAGIVLGEAIKAAVGDKGGIRRYGSFALPMDETLVLCALDLSGRPYYVSDVAYNTPMLGDLDTGTLGEFFYAVSYAAGMNLHFHKIWGDNSHHLAEACFKAFAKALDAATSLEPRLNGGIWSTKDAL